MAPRPVPTRTCVACRTGRPKRDLQRIVRTPDGRVIVDPGGREAGRGAYVCRDERCLSIAIDKGALHRALRTSLPTELRVALLAGIPTTPISSGGAHGQE